MTRIVIVDYGIGNIHSVERALKAVAPEANIQVSKKPEEIKKADRIVLPGQGAMSECMNSINQFNLKNILLDAIYNKPTLGICIGQHMMLSYSQESNSSCLNIFSGNVERFSGKSFSIENQENKDQSLLSNKPLLKVPHMGWNQVHFLKNHELWKDIPSNTYFYFVHSYYVRPDDSNIEFARTSYGIPFASAIGKENIFAVQFHPEKSSKYGLYFYRNFVYWKP